MNVAPALACPLQGPVLLALMLGMTGCGAGSSTTPVPLTVTLGASTLVVPQDGTPAMLPVTISPLNSTFSVTVSGMPSGVTQQNSTSSSAPLGMGVV
jgi:hypothetical protein